MVQDKKEAGRRSIEVVVVVDAHEDRARSTVMPASRRFPAIALRTFRRYPTVPDAPFRIESKR